MATMKIEKRCGDGDSFSYFISDGNPRGDLEFEIDLEDLVQCAEVARHWLKDAAAQKPDKRDLFTGEGK